jgi:hypothetical protein
MRFSTMWNARLATYAKTRESEHPSVADSVEGFFDAFHTPSFMRSAATKLSSWQLLTIAGVRNIGAVANDNGIVRLP